MTHVLGGTSIAKPTCVRDFVVTPFLWHLNLKGFCHAPSNGRSCQFLQLSMQFSSYHGRPLGQLRKLLNNVASIATSGHFYQAILSLTIQQGLNNPRLSSFIRISQGPLDHMAGGAVGSHCRHLAQNLVENLFSLIGRMLVEMLDHKVPILMLAENIGLRKDLLGNSCQHRRLQVFNQSLHESTAKFVLGDLFKAPLLQFLHNL
mmetsp:Transcript_112078/g.157152  ORF Transcript_112078/g.157152 Transcript_112078/m.157152 type:complete len:204 (-) Transcript_112078:734-1345(-)